MEAGGPAGLAMTAAGGRCKGSGHSDGSVGELVVNTFELVAHFFEQILVAGRADDSWECHGANGRRSHDGEDGKGLTNIENG